MSNQKLYFRSRHQTLHRQSLFLYSEKRSNWIQE